MITKNYQKNIRSILVLTFMLCILSVSAQDEQTPEIEVKTRTYTYNKTFTIVETVLANDTNLRHGAYYCYYNQVLVISGSFYKGKKYGPWKKYHHSGNLEIDAFYLHNKKHGKWVYYHDNKTIMAEIGFINGLKQGLWKSYYPNGNLSEQINYMNDTFHLENVRYYENGNVAMLIQKNKTETGQLQISTKYFYENTYPFLEYETIDGKLHGIYNKYHFNKILWEKLLYDNGKLMAVLAQHEPKGSRQTESSIENGNGTYFSYHNDGKLYCEITYKNGLKHGKAVYYVDKFEREEGNYTNDMLAGLWKAYHFSGNLNYEKNFLTNDNYVLTVYTGTGKERIETDYYKGEKHGKEKSYNFYGEVDWECGYTYGKKSGEYKKYAEGSIREIGAYTAGIKIGEWNYYNSRNKLTYKDKFDNYITFDTTDFAISNMQEIIYKNDFSFSNLKRAPQFNYGSSAYNLYMKRETYIQSDYSLVKKIIDPPLIKQFAGNVSSNPYGSYYTFKKKDYYELLINVDEFGFISVDKIIIGSTEQINMELTQLALNSPPVLHNYVNYMPSQTNSFLLINIKEYEEVQKPEAKGSNKKIK
jgi:antitoxin component YwqK of YwqJK toxin-antitoxin module